MWRACWWTSPLLLVTACGSMRPVATEPLRTELPERAHVRLADDLKKMAVCWDGMQRGSAAARQGAQHHYEAALEDFLTQWKGKQSPRYWTSGLRLSDGKTGNFVVEFDAAKGRRQEKSPLEYDDLFMLGLVRQHENDTLAKRSGLGVPLVGCVNRTTATRKEMPFLPPNGGHSTLTAVMEMGAVDATGSQHCKLRLLNALNTDTVQVAGREEPLAADFTAPKHLALSRRSFIHLTLTGLFYPEKALGDCQLYRMDDYDPKRIPVVFVHGLMSDPHIWLNAVNAITADPVLRAKYQPWYFLYPTAVGVPQAAERLRRTLNAAREYFDPDHNDPGMNQMVLVGHSMGGLLSRLQVTDSGNALWGSMFSKPPELMDISDTTRDRLTRSLFVKPLPYVKRAVFICTPHRGSKVASFSIVRSLTNLIRVPLDSLNMANELLRGNADALSPQICQWGVFSFLSVGMLSDKHPLMKGLDQTQPVVPHHSIIGDRGLPWDRQDRSKSSDGVVSYTSSHLPSAQSERMVPHGHICVGKDDVVAEVMRVLRDHAAKR